MFTRIIIDSKNTLFFEINRANSTASALSVTSSSEPSSKVALTIRHPGNGKTDFLAFKIKTTNPKRYLVRPHQGLIAPYDSQTVTILMIEKEKHLLIEEYSVNPKKKSNIFRTKDKFLVQSYMISAPVNVENCEETLDLLWGTISKFKFANNTLNVRCAIVDFAMSTTSSITSTDNMSLTASHTTDRHHSSTMLYNELISLRKKFLDLSSFSEHLISEHDVLKCSIDENKLKLERVRLGLSENSNILYLLFKLIFFCILVVSCFVIGIRCGFQNIDKEDPWWCHVPILWLFF